MAKQPDAASVIVIAVNYDTDPLAVRFVREVTESTAGVPHKIVLVDNSERADSAELFDQILAENPSVRCLKPPTNLGYLGGAAYGLKHCTSPGHSFDWVMISNVDVSFPDREFFHRLIALKNTRDVGVVAPSIQSSITLHDQNPFMPERPSRARMRFYRALHKSYYLLNLYEALAAGYHLLRSTVRFGLGRLPAKRDRASDRASEGIDQQGGKPVQIYAPHGACMIFSSAFFARGGSLEVPFFLYGEEIYVAETTRALGLQVIYDPSLRLQHDEHQSTGLGRVFLSREAAKHLREATDYLVDSYFG